MVVKLANMMSEPREVWGGYFQGSILGVFLFNATIDNLEEGCEDITQDPAGVTTNDRTQESCDEERAHPRTTGDNDLDSTEKKAVVTLQLAGWLGD